MDQHPALADQFSEDEAREIAGDIAASVGDEVSGVTMPIKWAIEKAVCNAFGYEPEE